MINIIIADAAPAGETARLGELTSLQQTWAQVSMKMVFESSKTNFRINLEIMSTSFRT